MMPRHDGTQPLRVNDNGGVFVLRLIGKRWLRIFWGGGIQWV